MEEHHASPRPPLVLAALRRVPALHGYRSTLLLELAGARMRALGEHDEAAYVARLADRSEVAALAADRSIVQTGFFRDRALWRVLRSRVVPDLVARRRAGQVLNVWVAGCASGEELYSLAMLFADRLDDGYGRALRLLGTDLNGEAVACARRGLYSQAALARVPERMRAAYWRRYDRAFVVSGALRAPLSFAQRDLLRDRSPSPVDLILCCNTLIYFDPHVQTRLRAAFHYVLRDGGYLVLGRDERMRERDEVRFEAEHADLGVYRKLAQPGRHPWIGYGCNVLSSRAALPMPARPAPSPLVGGQSPVRGSFVA